MVSIKKMNLAIAEWLYGEGNIRLIDHWADKNNRLVGRINFHENYDALMEAMQKAMGAGIEFNNSDAYKKTLWYAIYPELKVVKSSEFIYTVDTYICAFTEIGKGRLGYGKKLNKEFKKASPILAMHYSLYRLIKNGLEY